MGNFEHLHSVHEIVDTVNTTLFNIGLTSNMLRMKEFSHRLWDCLNGAIDFENCQIYSYIPDYDSDPFGEAGCMYIQVSNGISCF